MQRDYYTVEEVAHHFRVSEETVRNLCKDGKIQGARKIGRQWRIPASYVEDNASLTRTGIDRKEHKERR